MIVVPNKTIQWIFKAGFLFDLSLKKKDNLNIIHNFIAHAFSICFHKWTDVSLCRPHLPIGSLHQGTASGHNLGCYQHCLVARDTSWNRIWKWESLRLSIQNDFPNFRHFRKCKIRSGQSSLILQWNVTDICFQAPLIKSLSIRRKDVSVIKFPTSNQLGGNLRKRSSGWCNETML